MNLKLSLPTIPFADKLKPLLRYRLVVFIVFVAGLSAYLVMQINQAINVAPSEEVKAAAAAKVPKIDPALVRQLQSLEDNSVTVKALFNEARENPFQ